MDLVKTVGKNNRETQILQIKNRDWGTGLQIPKNKQKNRDSKTRPPIPKTYNMKGRYFYEKRKKDKW